MNDSMVENLALGYTLPDGTKVTLDVGIYDWPAMRGVAEDALYKWHVQNGGTEESLPTQDIVVVDSILRHFEHMLTQMEKKIDELHLENANLKLELLEKKRFPI